MSEVLDQTVVGKECKFAIFIPKTKNNNRDLHLIKEVTHYADGRKEPKLTYIENFKRTFYITKEAYRNHKDKKESESIDKLHRYETTQSDLVHNVAKALGKPWSNGRLNDLAESPYLYGTDVPSTSLIKYRYQKKYPECFSDHEVAAFDVETDVLHGQNTYINIASIAFKKRIFIGVLESFVQDYLNVYTLEGLAEKIKELFYYYRKKTGDDANIDITVGIYKTEIEVIQRTMDKAHEWKPDILAIWNMDFDINRILEACKRASINPTQIFNDPSIDPSIRYFKYIQGKTKKITASKKVKPINPSSQWHIVRNIASFNTLDAMCCYRQLRSQDKEEKSYSLDSILLKHLNKTKFKFEPAVGKQGLEWHRTMQLKHPLEYIVYNAYDTLRMIELDDVTADLKSSMPSLSGYCDSDIFNSQPKRIVNGFYYFAGERNEIIGSYHKKNTWENNNDEDKEEEEPEEPTLSIKGWVLTLHPNTMLNEGAQCIRENKFLRTNVRFYVSDLDEVGSYPYAILTLNVSKRTSKREVISIDDVDEDVYRLQNINLLSGHVNAVDYATKMFGFPMLNETLAMYQAEKNKHVLCDAPVYI